MPGRNYNISLVSQKTRCGQSLFSGEVNVYYKPHSYSISAGSGINWRRTKNRV